MRTINSRADIENYVTNTHPDASEHGLVDALVDAIQSTDHPDYGLDWYAWLDANAYDLLTEIAGDQHRFTHT